MDLSNENVIHVKKGDIQYLQFKRLLEYKDKIVHAFTLRPLDIKQKNKYDESYKKICNELNLDNENLVMPIQTHTNAVDVVDDNSKSAVFENIDGLVTDMQNLALATVFADCTPLLFYDPEKNVIGNVHSGWRGTVTKIGEVAVKKMINNYGCNPTNIICCIGPSIRQCHFEVEDDVKNLFMEAFNDESIIENKGFVDGKQKYNINAVKAIKNMLKDCGLKPENIIDCDICTVCNSNLIHSHRAEKGKSGRNSAVISLLQQ